MWHFAVGHVAQMELHGIALTHADETARHGAAKGPEGIADAFGNGHVFFNHIQRHDDLGRFAAPGRRRHMRWRGQNGFHRLTNGRAEVPFGGATGFLAMGGTTGSRVGLFDTASRQTQRDRNGQGKGGVAEEGFHRGVPC